MFSRRAVRGCYPRLISIIPPGWPGTPPVRMIPSPAGRLLPRVCQLHPPVWFTHSPVWKRHRSGWMVHSSGWMMRSPVGRISPPDGLTRPPVWRISPPGGRRRRPACGGGRFSTVLFSLKLPAFLTKESLDDASGAESTERKLAYGQLRHAWNLHARRASLRCGQARVPRFGAIGRGLIDLFSLGLAVANGCCQLSVRCVGDLSCR